MRQLEFPENIQAIVGGKEYSLDNAVLKIWPESEETNGEYASAIRSFKHNLDIQKIHINFDIKDTIGGKRTRELHGALCNNIYDFKSEVILGLNQIQSHESEIMQLADLFIGALSYFHRGLYSIQEGKAKSEIIDIIKELSKQRLDKSSVRDEKKFNIFIWKPVGER